MYRASRPFGVTLLSAWYFITGLFTFIGGLFQSVFGALAICFSIGILGGGIWGVITGILNILLGGALWTGRDWAPAVVSILAVIGIVTGVIGILQTGFGLFQLINIAINVFVLLYMQSKDVKHFFATN